jgi:hypothetical protein
MTDSEKYEELILARRRLYESAWPAARTDEQKDEISKIHTQMRKLMEKAHPNHHEAVDACCTHIETMLNNAIVNTEDDVDVEDELELNCYLCDDDRIEVTSMLNAVLVMWWDHHHLKCIAVVKTEFQKWEPNQSEG